MPAQERRRAGLQASLFPLVEKYRASLAFGSKITQQPKVSKASYSSKSLFSPTTSLFAGLLHWDTQIAKMLWTLWESWKQHLLVSLDSNVIRRSAWPWLPSGKRELSEDNQSPPQHCEAALWALLWFLTMGIGEESMDPVAENLTIIEKQGWACNTKTQILQIVL